MKRFLMYLLIFLVSFSVTVIYTFPADRLLGYILSKNGISYRSIKGNIFHLKVEGLSTGIVSIKSLDLSSKFPEYEIKINGQKVGTVNIFTGKINVSVKDFDISSIQRKVFVSGRISSKLEISVDKKIRMNGEGKAFISKISNLPVSNVAVNYTVKYDDDKNKVSARITGKVLNGIFEGEIYLPVNIKKGYIKGRFEGNIFNGKVKREINLKLSQLNI